MRRLLLTSACCLVLALAGAMGNSPVLAQAPARGPASPVAQAPGERAAATQPPGVRTAAAPPRAGNPGQQSTPPAKAGANNAAQADATDDHPTVRQREPQPPFVLTEAEQKFLDQILGYWEQKSSKTNTFKSKFRRWEYDEALAISEKDAVYKEKKFLRTEAAGEIKYKSPDMGMFRLYELKEYDPNVQKYEPVKENLEHWVCDGQAIYEFKPSEKKLQVHPIPKEMQGEAISDGPIPFIFGAKADKLKARYWLRERTPKEEVGKHTWLEVYPKYQYDASNFQVAVVILNDVDFTIHALQIYMPGGKQRSAYQFSNAVINDPFSKFKGDFAAPTTPSGWTKEVDKDSPPPTAERPTEGAGSRAATRGAAPARR